MSILDSLQCISQGEGAAGALQVRNAAAATAERESRALAALEHGTAERSASLVARECRLQQREEAVGHYCDSAVNHSCNTVISTAL